VFLKPKYFYANLGFADTILAIQDPKQYKIRRMQVNPFFTPQAMDQCEGIMFEEARKMISRLNQTPKRDEFVDITGEVGRLIVSLSSQFTQHLHFRLNFTRLPRLVTFFLEHPQTTSCKMMLPPSLRASILGLVQSTYCAAFRSLPHSP
jgi:hypothetical protein